MSIAVWNLRQTDSLLTLRGPLSLSEDLGSFGVEVPPRLTTTHSIKLEEKDWCLRRLLIAMVVERLISFPLHIERGTPEQKRPDYVFRMGKSGSWGIRITQAGSERYHRWLAERSKAINGESHVGPFRPGGYTHETARQILVSDLREAFADEAAHTQDHYAGVGPVDLAVYVNSEANEFPGKLDLSAAGREAVPEEALARFQRLHLIRGDGGLLVLDLGLHQHTTDISCHYDHDFSAWLQAQANALRAGAFDELDPLNIAEELEGLAKKDRREVKSHLRILLLHALKWEFQASRRSRSWQRSIHNAREKLKDVLADNPSLSSEDFLQTQLVAVYPTVRKQALSETRLPPSAIPDELPFAISQLLNPEYPASNDAKE